MGVTVTMTVPGGAALVDMLRPGTFAGIALKWKKVDIYIIG